MAKKNLKKLGEACNPIEYSVSRKFLVGTGYLEALKEADISSDEDAVKKAEEEIEGRRNLEVRITPRFIKLWHFSGMSFDEFKDLVKNSGYKPGLAEHALVIAHEDVRRRAGNDTCFLPYLIGRRWLCPGSAWEARTSAQKQYCIPSLYYSRSYYREISKDLADTYKKSGERVVESSFDTDFSSGTLYYLCVPATIVLRNAGQWRLCGDTEDVEVLIVKEEILGKK